MLLGDSIRRLSGKIVLSRGRRYLRRLRELSPHVRHIQRWLLHEKIALHRESQFGRDHGLPAVRSVWDFRRQVPVASYEDYQPYLEQLKRGDQQALLGPRERLVMFALTSGTTDVPKLIPVTRRFVREYRAGWTMWGTQVVLDHPETIENPPYFRPKRILHLASAFDEFRTDGGIPCGAISGLMARTQNAVVRSIYCLPPAVLDIKDPLAKYYTILRLSVGEIVGKVVTANPSTLVTLARFGDEWKSALIRDIAEGTLSRQFEVPGAVRSRLSRRLRADATCARKLERIAERTGTLYPKDYWPSLKLVGTWTGGTVGAYVDHLPRYYGDVAIRDIGLLASEGRMTIPLEDGTPGGILDFLNTYFEFIPAREIDSIDPTVLEAHDLEEGEEYYIVLTTSAGLYRYHIKDLVRCVGYCGNTPLLEFLNKGSQFSSLTGEKLSEYQVVGAVRHAAEQLSIELREFVLAPCWSEPSYYVLLVEQADLEGRARRPREESGIIACDGRWMRRDGAHQPGVVGSDVQLLARRLADRVDELLKQRNCEYQAKRSSGRLGPVRVRMQPDGTWHRFGHQQRTRRGGAIEQYKHPCLVEDVSFLAGFSGLEESHSRAV